MTNNSESLLKQKSQLLFAFCGIIGPILFTFLIIVEGFIRPGYNPIVNDISDLGLGPHALIQNINFIIFGLLAIGLALGIGAKLPYRAGKAVKWLVIIFGLGTMLAGVSLIFSAPGVIHASNVLTHIIVSIFSFISITIAQFLTWQALKGSDDTLWKRYGRYSLISGLLSILTFLLFILPSSFSYSYNGAAERLFVGVFLVWIEVTGLILYYNWKNH